MDLLDYDHNPEPYEPSYEEALGIAMKRQWEDDQKKIKERRIIPDWWGEPKILSKDKAAILELLYELGCFEWSSHPCKNNIKVSSDLNLPIAHIKGKLDEMHKDGLIASLIYRNKRVFELTQEGEYALSEYFLEKELENL